MNDYKLIDELTGQGYTNVYYDEGTKNVSARNKKGETVAFNTSGLNNVDNHLVGTQQQIQSIVNNPLIGVRDKAIKEGVNVGYDQYNNPVLNGQSADTTGMANVNGRWYAAPNSVNSIIAAVKPQEYVNPYAETQKNLLYDLYNYKDFSYNPESDNNLQTAMGFARRQAQRNAVDRGQGNSFGMEYAANSAANNLIPQYEDKAYQKYLDARNYLAQLFGLTSDAERNERETYQMNRNFRNSDREFSANQDYNARMLQNADKENALNREQFDWKKATDERDFYRNVYEFDQNLGAQLTENDRNYYLNLEKLMLDKASLASDIDYKNMQVALSILNTLGEADEFVEQKLGIPRGTKTIDALQAYAQINNLNSLANNRYASAASKSSAAPVEEEANYGFTGH